MGDAKDIEHIYSLYVDDLYTYASYMGFDEETIMDAIHDVFCKLAAAESFLNPVVNLKFYLFAALKNRLLDMRRTRMPQVSLSSMDVSAEASFNINVTVVDDLTAPEEQNRIRNLIGEMLDTLTDRQREIVYLRYVQEYDYPQIARLLGISINGCRKLLSKAIQSLRAQYGEQNLLFLLLCGTQLLKF